MSYKYNLFVPIKIHKCVHTHNQSKQWTISLDPAAAAAAAAAKLLQSCPTLCDPIDSSPPGSPVPGILQARTLQWVTISFSNAWKWKVKVKSLSRVWLFATPWTVVYQARLSIGFSGQEYWSGVLLPSPSLGPTNPQICWSLYTFTVTNNANILWVNFLSSIHF